MEAISYVSRWISWILALVGTGTAVMVAYQSARKAFSLDEGVATDADKKIKTTIKAAIIIVTLSSFIAVVKKFYL